MDALPELEDSHAALSSTWDRTGGNGDDADFQRIEADGRNIRWTSTGRAASIGSSPEC